MTVNPHQESSLYRSHALLVLTLNSHAFPASPRIIIIDFLDENRFPVGGFGNALLTAIF